MLYPKAGIPWSAVTLSERTCRTPGLQSTILSSTVAPPQDRSRKKAATARPLGWLQGSKSGRPSSRTPRLKTKKKTLMKYSL